MLGLEDKPTRRSQEMIWREILNFQDLTNTGCIAKTPSRILLCLGPPDEIQNGKFLTYFWKVA